MDFAERMEYSERKVLASLISTGSILVIYVTVSLLWLSHDRFDGAQGLRFTGQWLLAVMALSVLGTALMNALLLRPWRREGQCLPVKDERDHALELQGLQLSYLVFTCGLVPSLLALAMGASAALVFMALLASLMVAELAAASFKLYRYRSSGGDG